MVKTAILVEKIKQYFLWGGLAVLTVPTLPLQAYTALNNGINSVRHLLKNGRRPLPESALYNDKPKEDGITDMPDDHPLRQWADEHARAEGLAGTRISFESARKGTPVQNACVNFEDNKANIRFLGDPESDDREYIKSVISHELGHHKAGDSRKFAYHAMNTTSAYAVMMEYGGASALLLHGLQSVRDHPWLQMVPPDLIANLPSPSQPLMLAAASFLAIPMVARLTQKFNHSVEHLADMKSAEIMGPHQTVEFFAQRDIKQEVEAMALEAQRKLTKGPKRHHVSDLSLIKSWSDTLNQLSSAVRDTHPKTDKRMEFIRNAYGLLDNTTAAAEPAVAHNASSNTQPKNLF